ncbi:PD-(D/E)XK nuclease family transposase [Anaerobutyricum hallii]|uniref:PD-(D/E)XK nuclease family transposase n=1 Tax=Anaerobutyricum hallii TaxID=39488 RepID=A0A285PUZ0_9FIRM|nr:Rpn family recombination-promoting nuclease/putative transposase [Anaerobutyricum hallii]SOB73429.1 PD-(D/E)XK nuclease family transposase [Anaerobutyricum hallii]
MTDSIILQPESLEERYERYKEKIKHFTIMNDIFMRNVLKEISCTEYILQVIMNKKELKVIDQTLQKDYKNLQGRSAILDCVAKDVENNFFNVEIQGENDGASPKRARYHCGLLDMNLLNPGDLFDSLPETYVIFITKNDVLGYNRPISHIQRRIKETEDIFQDGQHILYVNSKKQDDTELGRLMHDLHCKEAGKMYNNILATRVHQLKETEEGVKTMCQELEEIYNEGEQSGFLRGEQSGKLKAKKETTLSLLEMGMSVEQIAQAVNLSIETVQDWIYNSDL